MNDDVRAVLDGSARWCVVNADCREVMPVLGARSVDAVVSDPPYGTGQWQRSATGAGSDCRAVHKVETWDVWEPAWIDDALRVARGPVLTYLPNTRIEELLARGRETGLSTRLLLWCKTDPRPRFSGQPAFGFEPVVAFRALTGGETDWFAASAPRVNRDREATGHPHAKPVDVDRWLVRLSTEVDGVVFVPHGGRGTTAIAALSEGRRVILCERDPEHAAYARDWCGRFVSGARVKSEAQPVLFGGSR
jgi:site-specific DNA-methyltransferase (adenine-specific)